MAKDKYHIESLTPELIEKYHQGSLSEEEQYAVEKLMLNSAFDADAMDGFESNSNLIGDLTELNRQLETRIAREKNSTFTFWLKIAASVLLLAVCAYFVYDASFKQPIYEDTLAQQKNEVIDSTNDTGKENVDLELSNKDENKTSSEPTPDLIASNKSPIPIEKKESQVTSQPAIVQSPVKENEFLAITDENVEDDNSEIVSESIEAPQIAALEGEKYDAFKMDQKASEGAKTAARSAKSKKLSAVLESKSISGKVTSAEDGAPLVGVNVVIKGSTQGTVTDLDGNYKLNLPLESDEKLVFSFIGLASEEVDVNNRDHLDMAMNSDVQQLSEVVMTRSTGNAADAERIGYENSEPVIGKSAYKDYLKDSLRYSAEMATAKGKVVVKFDIETDGSLANFEIKKSMGEFYDQEAIRLIKEGPKWKPAMNNGQATKSSSRVTVRFNR